MPRSLHHTNPRRTKLTQTSPLQAVATWFRDRRRALGVTQKALATDLGLTQSTISDLERGDIHVGLSTLLLAVEKLGGELRIGPRSLKVDLSEALMEVDVGPGEPE